MLGLDCSVVVPLLQFSAKPLLISEWLLALYPASSNTRLRA
jgi:hypothetical protein